MRPTLALLALLLAAPVHAAVLRPDCSQLQSALDDLCETRGGTIYLPDGAVCDYTESPKATCLHRIRIATEGKAATLRYVGSGARGFDFRGVRRFRLENVVVQCPNPVDCLDFRLSLYCEQDVSIACETDADCGSKGPCEATNFSFAGEVLLDRVYVVGAPTTEPQKLLALKHAVHFDIQSSEFWFGGYHVYGVDSMNEWTSEVHVRDSHFHNAGICSLWNLTWQTSIKDVYHEPQGVNGDVACAYGHDPGILVNGFSASGWGLWDLPAGATGTWIRIAGRGINLAGLRMEALVPSVVADGVKIDELSSGVTIPAPSCTNLRRCLWAAAPVSGLSILALTAQGVNKTIHGDLGTCALVTPTTVICG